MQKYKTLFNFESPVTDDEIQAAALQFVRKVTGFNKPSKANEAAVHAAINRSSGGKMQLMNKSGFLL